MQRLEVSGVVRPLYGSLGVKGLTDILIYDVFYMFRSRGFIFRKTDVRTV